MPINYDSNFTAYQNLLTEVKHGQTHSALRIATQIDFAQIKHQDSSQLLQLTIEYENYSLLAYLLKQIHSEENLSLLEEVFNFAQKKRDVYAINLLSPYVCDEQTQQYISKILRVLIVKKDEDIFSFKKIQDFFTITKEFLSYYFDDLEQLDLDLYNMDSEQSIIEIVKRDMMKHQSSPQTKLIYALIKANLFIHNIINCHFVFNNLLSLLFQRLLELDGKPELQLCYLSLLYEFVKKNNYDECRIILKKWEEDPFLGNFQKTNLTVLTQADDFGITQSNFFSFSRKKIPTNRQMLEMIKKFLPIVDSEETNDIDNEKSILKPNSPIEGEGKKKKVSFFEHIKRPANRNPLQQNNEASYSPRDESLVMDV